MRTWLIPRPMMNSLVASPSRACAAALRGQALGAQQGSPSFATPLLNTKRNAEKAGWRTAEGRRGSGGAAHGKYSKC